MVKEDEAYRSPENIVLKGKQKKSSKIFVEISGIKTIKDLIKYSDKEKIIIFCPSTLKAEERLKQI